MSDFVKLETKNNVAVVTLNRPDKKNALTFNMLEKLSKIGRSLKLERNIIAVIIQSSSQTFCSGIDIKNFAVLAADKDFLNSVMVPVEGSKSNKMQDPCTIWQELDIPVIAVLEGSTFGAGLQLALGADIRIASRDTILSIMETKWGLIPDMGITSVLPKLLSYDQALRLTLRADLINATEALSLGLVTQCVENPHAEALKWVKKLSITSPDATRFTKKLYREAWLSANSTNLKLEAYFQTKLVGTPNQMEAVLSNFEKRSPQFQHTDYSNDR